MKQRSEEHGLSENHVWLLCLILHLCAHGSALCPDLAHLYVFAWVSLPPLSALTLSPPVPVGIPQNQAQIFSAHEVSHDFCARS